MPSPVPDENFTLLSQLFGAAGHLWSIGTLAGFMGLDLTGAPTVTGEGLVLSSGAVTARRRLRRNTRRSRFEPPATQSARRARYSGALWPAQHSRRPELREHL